MQMTRFWLRSKVMRSASDSIVGEMNIMMGGLVLKVVEVFMYSGSLVTAVGGVEADIQRRVFGGNKVLGAARNVLKVCIMSLG